MAALRARTPPPRPPAKSFARQRQIRIFNGAPGGRLTNDQTFFVNAKRAGQCFRSPAGAAIGQHRDQPLKHRLAIGREPPLLTRARFSQAEKQFAFRAKSFGKFRCRREIVWRTAGAQIDNHRIHFFRSEVGERSVHPLEICCIERPETQITNMPIKNLTVK